MYRVADWDKHFENNRTRELKHMAWVPLPNKHDGDGYRELVQDHPQGAAHYGAWCVIVAVASKCDPRGTLLRDGNRPHDCDSLSRKTGIPAEVFAEAIPRLIAIGWLLVTHSVATIPQDDAAKSQDGAIKPQEPALNGTELNGMELRERERLEPWSTWLDKLKATGKVPDTMKADTLGDYCSRVGCKNLTPHLDALIHDLEGATGIVGSVTWWTKHLTDIMHPPEQRSQRSKSTVRRKGDPDYVEYR